MIRRTPGVEAQCAQCGNCCRWPGFVRISLEETASIARFLGLKANAFTDRYTRLLPDRSGLGLIETADGACVFLEGNACRIHPVKPRQCRDFPAVWSREEAESPCQITQDVLPSQIETIGEIYSENCQPR